ncbi:MAG: PAS domain S-box protein [Desulfomonilaceae bacterium]|nr:PAS domain S-box protein [Desulfomonilaceae bacterium]
MTLASFEKSVPRILIVQDETQPAQELAQSVTDCGYEAVEMPLKADGAVRSAIRSKPDLVLMDIHPPGVHEGLDACSKIREHLDIPVIYLTTYSDMDVLDRARKTEPYGFLGKPVSLRELRITLETALQSFAAGKRIKRSEDKLRVMVETVPHGIGEIDPYGNITFVNKAYCGLYGYSRDEMLGKSILDLQVSRTEAVRLREYLADVRAERPDPSPWFSQEITKDGRLMDVRVDWNYEFDNHGDLEGFVFVVTDMTELRQRESALVRADERIRKAEELAGMGSWEWDIGTGKLNWSEGTFRAFGYDSRYVDPHFDLFVQSVHPDDKAKVEGAIGEALAGKGSYDVEFRIVRPDGTERLLHSRGEVVCDGRGIPERTFGMSMDVTESRQAEKALLEREDLISFVSDHLPYGMMYQVVRRNNATRKFTYLSERVRDFYGCSPEEAINDAELIYGRIHPEDRGRVYLEEEKCCATLSGFSSEVRMINPSGDVRWSYFASSPTRLEDGATSWTGLEIDITQRKRSEEALRESEQRFRDLFDNLRDGVAWVDERGRFVRCNPRVLHMLGYSFEELTNLTYNDITPHRWHAEELRIGEQQVHVRGYSDLYEKEYIHKNGTVFPVEVQTYLAKDSDGRMTGYWAFVRDITDRKKSEEELSRRQEEFRRIVENLPDPFYRVDMTGVITFLSPASEKVTGYRPEEVIGHRMKNYYFDPLERKEFRRLLAQDGHVNGLEIRLRHKNGGIVWVSTSATLYRDKDGNPVGAEGIARDITDRKNIELALIKSEQRYRSLAESSPTCICLHQDGKIVYVNERGADSFGYTVQDLVGRSIWKVIAAEDREQAMKFTASLLRRDKVPANDEFRILTRDGRVRWVEALCTVVEHEGRPGVLVNLLDITDQKCRQQELQEARAAAERANRAKTDFLARMTHEFRTPLNGIIGFSEILVDEIFGDLNDTQKRYVGLILNSGRHLLKLVSQVLDLSKIEAGGMELDLSRVRIGNILENALAVMKEQGLCKNLELELKVDLENNGMTIWADELKLTQVVFNLLSNAIKFTPENGRIQVEARRVDDELVISVCDTGIGIDSSDTSLIFRAFEQVDSSPSRRHEGTGLGLSLAQQFVAMHGGRIWVESGGLGRGSTFRFTIPLKDPKCM